MSSARVGRLNSMTCSGGRIREVGDIFEMPRQVTVTCTVW
jgi:hypothetical protein